MAVRTLQSWKEIAEYLGRGVRTVQRWEAFHGLPIHRPAGRARSAVYALEHEVDAWLSSAGYVMASQSDEDVRSIELRLLERLQMLEAECERIRRQLANDVDHSSNGHARAIEPFRARIA